MLIKKSCQKLIVSNVISVNLYHLKPNIFLVALSFKNLWIHPWRFYTFKFDNWKVQIKRNFILILVFPISLLSLFESF